MEDNATTNNETDTYAPENVYPMDAFQSSNQPPLPPNTSEPLNTQPPTYPTRNEQKIFC